VKTLILAVSVCFLFVLGVFSGVSAQQFGSLTLPPSGDNQHSTVTQYIGLVQVSVDYNSPDVHAPDGSDRHGKIWGGLVPYGMANLGFGTCGDQCPWRGGANENTVFKVSHDVKVQGQPLKAGAYGLHFIPGENEWTIIFSNNSTSWGSFTYKQSEDALRVTAKPAKSEYHEWLTYEFTDRQPKQATVALKWEDLQLPWTITVDNIEDYYVQNIDRELQNATGFSPENWTAGAQYCLQTKTHLDKGLQWAQMAVDSPSYGRENFTTLSMLAALQEANGLNAEGKKTIELALNHRSAGPMDIHLYARGLQAAKKTDEANRIFVLNAQKFPKEWPTELGLMRMYSAKGQYKEALKHGPLALKQATSDQTKTQVQNLMKTLEEGKDIN
jgi:hypothetical protein